MKKTAATVGILFGLGVGMLAVPAVATAGEAFTGHIPGTIGIYARGAAAYVPLTYSCRVNQGMSFGYANAVITEALSGGRVAYAYTELGTKFVCDGRSHAQGLSLDAKGLGTPNYALLPSARVTIDIALSQCNADETFCQGGPFFESHPALVSSTSSPNTSSIQPMAHLLSGTGGAAVRTTFQCQPGSQESVAATITQRASLGTTLYSNLFTTPRADVSPQCDGRSHSVWLNVPPPVGGTFRRGTAWVQVVIFPAVSGHYFNSTSAARVVTLEAVS